MRLYFWKTIGIKWYWTIVLTNYNLKHRNLTHNHSLKAWLAETTFGSINEPCHRRLSRVKCQSSQLAWPKTALKISVLRFLRLHVHVCVSTLQGTTVVLLAPLARASKVCVLRLLLYILSAVFSAFASPRRSDIGSTFIRAVVAVFYKFAHIHHIEDLAAMVRYQDRIVFANSILAKRLFSTDVGHCIFIHLDCLHVMSCRHP